MDIVFSVIVPVFGLIVIGFLVAHFQYLRPEITQGLSDFVFRLAIPVLIFKTIATADFSGATPWGLWGSYFIAVAITWSIGATTVGFVFKRDAHAGVVAGVSSTFANTVLVGIPLVILAFGQEGTAPLFLIISIHLPTMLVISYAMKARAEHVEDLVISDTENENFVKLFLRTILSNPIAPAVLLGGIWNFAGLPYAGVPAVLMDKIAAVAGTVALIAMGMSLTQYKISGNVLPALSMSFFKLLLLPALVWLLGTYLFGLSPLWLKVAVITAACPTGVNAFLIASLFQTGHALSSNTIFISTLASMGTLTFWLLILQ